MEWLGAVAFVVVVLAVVLWPLTLGRRYFTGEKRSWPQIRRDLYGGSYDDGIYPLDPRSDAEDQRARRE